VYLFLERRHVLVTTFFNALEIRLWNVGCSLRASVIRQCWNQRGRQVMRRTTLFALLTVFSVLAFAESWQGRLIDATCYEQNQSAVACDATGSTTMFALLIANKAYKLDEAGNIKAVEALKSRADCSSDPATPASSQVMATITGTKDGSDVLKVETVEIR
jgi:hypothetical protein